MWAQLTAALPFSAHTGGWLEHMQHASTREYFSLVSKASFKAKPAAPGQNSVSRRGGTVGTAVAVSYPPTVPRYQTLIDFLCAGVEAKNGLLGPYYRR